jgi:hypothetical protein
MQFVPFAPRPIAGLGPPATIQGFALKPYTVCHAPPAFDPRRFDACERLIEAALGALDVTEASARVGFVIQHQGRDADYLVLAWWSRQNELPIRVWVNDGAGWRPARDGESVCVWDLEIIWFERNLWIETVLSGQDIALAIPEYLSRYFRQDPER